MPSINIREIDRTGSEQVSYIDNLALIPGMKIEAYNEYLELETLDGEYQSVTSFVNRVYEITKIALETTFESGQETEQAVNDKLNKISEYVPKEKGFAMAYLLLSKGLPIQYYGCYDVDAVKDKKGDVVKLVPDFDFDPTITSETSPYDKLLQDIASKYKDFEDRGKYDFKFVTPPYIDVDAEEGPEVDMNGKEADDKTTGSKLPIKDHFINYVSRISAQTAANRGDAIGLAYHPTYYKDSVKVDEFVNLEENKTFYQTVVQRKAVTWSALESYEEIGSYGTIYSSNFLTSFEVSILIDSQPEGSDYKSKVVSYNYIRETFPGYLDYLICYASFTRTKPTWYAISGSNAGASTLSTLIPLNKYGDADIAIFQPREAGDNDEFKLHIGINTITNIRPFGNVIWGNRTMHCLNKPVTGTSSVVQLVASDFLNIRSLCCDLKKTIYRAGRKYSFAPNSDVLWFNFKSEITPLLEKMKSNEGIRDYQILKVSTTKKAVLAARIIITPIEAVEDFDITVELVDSVQVTQ